jgi:putative membrane protein
MACSKNAGLWTEIAAGTLGGLAGAFVMGLAGAGLSKILGSKTQGGPQDATVLAAQRLLGRELRADQKPMAAQVVHYGFGAAMGALYGAASAAARPARAGAGMGFGAALYFGAHALAVPRLGLAESPLDTPLVDEAAEFAAHLVYGAVTEGVRRAVAATVS